MLRTVALLVVFAGCGDTAAAPDAAAPLEPWLEAGCTGTPGSPRVMVFSAENLWNHASNSVAELALLNLCVTHGFNVVATRDPEAFVAGHLDNVDVIVFAVTSGPVLTDEARQQFQAWLSSGHGMVGIHSASATELVFPFFIQSLGGQFCGHGPGLWTANLHVEDPAHPIAAGFPLVTTRTDEWYSFCAHPETDPNTHVIMSLDESTLGGDYPPELRMGFHPIAWTREGFGGRAFYTALGHTTEIYGEQSFIDMLALAIQWAAGT
jgi:type 1 glutamine amidotransferase